MTQPGFFIRIKIYLKKSQLPKKNVCCTETQQTDKIKSSNITGSLLVQQDKTVKYLK